MDDVELAYAAGIIDGEGYIGIQNKRTKNNYQLRVAVAMKYPIIPNWLCERFGGSVSTYNNAGKSLTMWAVSGHLAQDCCSYVLPYLIGKKLLAEVALDVPVSIAGKHTTTSEKDDYEFLYRVMKELNH